MDNALGHPYSTVSETFSHVLYLREHATAPAIKAMNSSDAGGCYVDSKPGGFLDMDKYRVKK